MILYYSEARINKTTINKKICCKSQSYVSFLKLSDTDIFRGRMPLDMLLTHVAQLRPLNLQKAQDRVPPLDISGIHDRPHQRQRVGQSDKKFEARFDIRTFKGSVVTDACTCSARIGSLKNVYQERSRLYTST